jgi:hypothetical protein
LERDVSDAGELSTQIGERNVRHPGNLARSQAWLESEFEQAGLEPHRQAYVVEGVTLRECRSRSCFIAFVGDVDSRALVRSVVDTFRRTASLPSEGAALPERTTGIGWSDHAPFFNAGYLALMVTDTALFRYHDYHRATDTPDKVDLYRPRRS